jgi:hypothetical protein
MATSLPEPDWALLKHLAQVAQERFCRQILGELGAILWSKQQVPSAELVFPGPSKGCFTGEER